MQAQWPNSRRVNTCALTRQQTNFMNIGLSAALGNLLNFVASHPHIRWEYWTADTSNNDHQLDSFTPLQSSKKEGERGTGGKDPSKIPKRKGQVGNQSKSHLKPSLDFTCFNSPIRQRHEGPIN
ncbi:hypothetical protein T03_7242 [Trichinella britovi]|uniref:Uncharacterized protein n=1 Tax=Trichinella britovi TaxID=45882 RepID=A0A0V1DIJ0_TRIBR|nr:hypothetical protein T03_7242 [Trichinella britovi]